MVIRDHSMNHFERYHLNRAIIEDQLNSKINAKYLMEEVDRYISANKQQQHADFTKDQYEWLDERGVNLSDLYFSSKHQKSTAMRVRLKSLLAKVMAAIVLGGIGILFFGGIA